MMSKRRFFIIMIIFMGSKIKKLLFYCSFFIKLKLKFQLLGQQSKTFTMVFCNAVFSYGFSMFFGGIAFVLFPVVHWKFFMNLVHIGISVGFCQDRSSGNM